MNWKTFKYWSESKFLHHELEECWGFQIQAGTQWNSGLTLNQINELEHVFGFEFPHAYRDMLLTMNGFDRDAIAIDPNGDDKDEFDRVCYKYPDDLPKVQWLIEEIQGNRFYVDDALRLNGFEPETVEGFVPLYSHRALVVCKDKNLSPVISIHQGYDVIVYGRSLMCYWINELLS